MMHREDPSISPTRPVVSCIPEGIRLIKSGMKCVATRERRVMSQFFGFTGLLISLLDELVFFMCYCANPQCERKGGDEERLDRHGFNE